MRKHFNVVRLRTLLGLFFLALAVPTGALIWQAYSQLKWEAFHQYRILAEDLTGRIDRDLRRTLQGADADSFADYTFLNVTGDSSLGYVQRSPLSEFPVRAGIPGLIGHFQVDSQGRFSSPLVPPAETPAEQVGINASELADRQRLARRIESILADNRLIRPSMESLPRQEIDGTIAEQDLANALRKREADDARERAGSRSRRPEASTSTRAGMEEAASEPAPTGRVAPAASPPADPADDAPAYSQRVFDQLNSPVDFADAASRTDNLPDTYSKDAPMLQQYSANEAIDKVSELKLDRDLQQKSEDRELAMELERFDEADAPSPGRAKRREQIAVPEAAVAAGAGDNANAPGPVGLRISTFESEIDPFEFSQLASGHFVLFRNVWRNDERYVQGLLIDPAAFLAGTVADTFNSTVLFSMSNLIVGYEDDVVGVYPGRQNSYVSSAGALEGALLYRSRLSAPLDRLELIFSVNRLPQAPGATVLAWVTVVLAIVFVAGFLAMYRLGLRQITLARQQQDFVSAVSHELKTPLTSIRMYGEMLKEGWADEAKRQDYYTFIHDEAERLTRMITNVLQLANITRNDPSYDLQTITVGEVLSNIESKISSQVERAGCALNITLEDSVRTVQVSLDVDCFAQIVINLVDNAIKFSAHADTRAIDIGATLTRDREVQFTVRDYGPGIPDDQLKKIFRLFYRSESELTRETVGTGIGLAIVRQLAAAMQGQVDVVNRQPGAEFRLRFPTAGTAAH